MDLTDNWDMHYRDQMWVGKSYASNIAKRWRAYIQLPLPQASDPFRDSTIQAERGLRHRLQALLEGLPSEDRYLPPGLAADMAGRRR